MSLTLTDVRRIAGDVAHQLEPSLEVMAARAAGGDETQYAEVILTVRGCREEPCRVVIGVSRETSEAECRGVVRDRLREHLHEHRPSLQSDSPASTRR